MKNNPIIPYVLIMAFGIVLVFFMSVDGASKKDDHAEGDGGTENVAFDAEAQAQKSCIGCHGGDLTGGVGPTLHGLTDGEHVKDVLVNGQGNMPGGLVPEANVDAMVEYILSLK